jgi:hypothetical protein
VQWAIGQWSKITTTSNGVSIKLFAVSYAAGINNLRQSIRNSRLVQTKEELFLKFEKINDKIDKTQRQSHSIITQSTSEGYRVAPAVYRGEFLKYPFIHLETYSPE